MGQNPEKPGVGWGPGNRADEATRAKHHSLAPKTKLGKARLCER